MAIGEKRALIFGVSGQDGTYLAELLKAKDYRVYGTTTSPSSSVKGEVDEVVTMVLPDSNNVTNLVGEVKPDEIYFLSAVHFSSQSDANKRANLEQFLSVNALSFHDVLKAVQRCSPPTKVFYAASAQVFGVPEQCPQDESCPRRPVTGYGVSKSLGMDICRYYREAQNVFVSAGILYNHESALRPQDFVSTQIVSAAAGAALGTGQRLSVRDLDAVADWGAAQDYVRAMWEILQLQRGDDFVIASGEPRAVREFIAEAYSHVGLDWRSYVANLGARAVSIRNPYVGNPRKIEAACGWKRSISFKELVASLVDSQLRRMSEGAPRSVHARPDGLS